MKISILKESMCIGGMERSVSNFSLSLSKNHEVETILFYKDIMAYPCGGKVYDMNLPAKKTLPEKMINNFKRIRLYKKHIRNFKPDIAFQVLTPISPVGLLKLKKCVKIVSARDFSALKNNIKKFKKRLDTSDAMICNSCYLKDYYLERYPEDKDKLFTVYNIIDCKAINEQASEAVDEDFLFFRKRHSKVIVSVGRFCKEKAFEYLIEAFARVRKILPDVGLVIIGDGDYKEKYLKIIKENELEDEVYLTGFQKNPYKYMSKCDAFVLSSLSEGFPNVLAEAMSLSLPVIATNCFTGPAEILMKNYDYNIVKEDFCECDYGILTPHYDAQGVEFAIRKMSEAILCLISDDNKMKKYGNQALIRAQNYSPDMTARKLEDIFTDMIDKKKR